MSFQIGLNTDSFVEKEGTVTGVLFLQIHGHAFPDPEWNDFPVVVQSGWLGAIASLLDGSAMKADCWFMDGPFRFELHTRDEDRWQLQLFDERFTPPLESVYMVEPSEVLAAVQGAAYATIAACEERRWQNDSVRELRHQWQRLSTLCSD